MLVSTRLSEVVYAFTGLLLIPAMIAWIACPIGILIIAYRAPASNQRLAPILAEVALCLIQFLALLPACT